jgi:ABC-type lipoprotein release transport system permease subunit
MNSHNVSQLRPVGGLVACTVPVRRALRIAPTEAMREG